MHHATRGTLIRRRLLEKKLRVGTGRLREKKLLLEKLTDALLTPEESEALGGVPGWKTLKDPLFNGVAAEHFFEHDPSTPKTTPRPGQTTRTCNTGWVGKPAQDKPNGKMVEV